ncbi:MAG: cytochrome c-type biogenesis protein CcmH [Reinekea sp.]
MSCWISVVAVAATEVLTFDNESFRERYAKLTYELRCPKCQNQNVADSLAPISEDIRHKTYEMLHQGYSDQEIIDFMVARYTEFVIYKPQLSIVTIWLWIIPAVLLLFGLLLLWRFTHSQPAVEDITLTEEEEQRLKTLLEDKTE